MVKKTVNQDDPTVYHLFYGDEDGSPGMDLTFFEYPGAAPGSRARDGPPHPLAGRLRAVARLLGGAPRAHGVEAELIDGSLLFADREGLRHELRVSPHRSAAARESPPGSPPSMRCTVRRRARILRRPGAASACWARRSGSRAPARAP